MNGPALVPSGQLSGLFADLEAAIAAAPPEELSRIRGELARLDTVALQRASAGPVEVDRGPDRLLTVDELAERLGKSVWWVYRRLRSHPEAFPYRKKMPGGQYRFSERGLERWLARS